MSTPKLELCYPVLTPTKFRGVIVKPPAFIQMSAAEAKPYQDAGIVGGEDQACLPPEGDNEHPSESGKDESTDRAKEGALDPAASQTPPAGVSGDGEPQAPRAPAKAAATKKATPARKKAGK